MFINTFKTVTKKTTTKKTKHTSKPEKNEKTTTKKRKHTSKPEENEKTTRKKRKVEKKEKIPIDPSKPISLRTRISTNSLINVIRSLNKDQKKAVRELGFGSLLKLSIDGIPGKLSRYVVNKFNPQDMKIHLPEASIEITKELVQNLIGVPIGKKSLYEIEHCDHTLKEFVEWKEQYDRKPMRPTDIERRIRKSKDSGMLFKINFVILFSNSFCEIHKLGTCKLTILPHLFGETIKDIDWCGHILNCLRVCKHNWDETDRGDYFCGPLIVLLVILFIIYIYI